MKQFIDKAELEELAHKYRTGKITPEEKHKFDLWFSEESADSMIVSDPDRNSSEEHQELIFQKIQARLEKGNTPVPKLFVWKKLKVAAAAVLLLSLGVWYASQYLLTTGDIQDVPSADIGPAQQKATLTLADGRKIELSELGYGEVANHNGIEITKSADGTLTYRMVQPRSTQDIAFDELSTAYGEQFRIILADGTKAWLNAGSTLRFPQHFDGQNVRHVFLTGEAYFEVARNEKQPFIVQSGTQKVEVLGTHFNVSHYPEEQHMRTTLLEGSVRINDKTILRPNQQAVSSETKIRVENVIAEDYVDWKSGVFTFKKENIVAVMRKISRWYDVEVAFQTDDIWDITFTGNISRAENASKVLYILEQSADLKFVLTDRKISVTKVKK